MKADILDKPAIPVAYGRLILDAARSHGLDAERLLRSQELPADLLDQPDGRLTVRQAGGLLYRTISLRPDTGIGYDIGLRSTLTSHGFLGYGLLSRGSLREAIDFGARFLQLRLPMLTLRLLEEDDQAIIDVTQTLPMGAVRQCMFDLFLVGLWRMSPPLLGNSASLPVVLYFDYAEPAYYAAYRKHLPTVRFGAESNQLRFPARYLDHTLGTADRLTARLVEQQCEDELSRLGYRGDVVAQARTLLVDPAGRYRGLDAVAACMNVSPRTLKRRLREHGLSFQQLQSERRRRDAIHLLRDPTLRVEEVAERMGYTDPANFSRAFRRWTGRSPSAYRFDELSPGPR